MAIRSSWSEKSDHYAQRASIVPYPSFYGVVGLFLAIIYIIFWILRLSPYWFNSLWLSRESFLELSLLSGSEGRLTANSDLVRFIALEKVPTLHLWLGKVLGSIISSPIIIGHTVMLLQLLIAITAIFFAVRIRSSSFPAFICITWILWCVPLISDFTVGLSSGWELPIAALYLLTSAYGKSSLSLLVILLAVLLAPAHLAPVLLLSEFLHTFWRVCRGRSRAISIRDLRFLLFLLPAFIAIFYLQFQSHKLTRPVVNYNQALNMQEFSNDGGMSPLVPFNEPLIEFQKIAEKVVIGAKYQGPEFLRPYLITITIGFLGVLIFIGMIRRSSICAAELWCLFSAASIGYFAARHYAFYLGLPSSFIEKLIPLILIMMISQSTWRVLYLGEHLFEVKNKLSEFWRHEIVERAFSVFTLLFFVLLLVISGGSGLNNKLKFNYHTGQDGLVFEWIRKNTVLNSIIVGDPRLLAGISLLSERIPYIADEATQPWIQAYQPLLVPRYIDALRIIYAKNSIEFNNALSGKEIDYVLLMAKNYDSDLFKNSQYGKPFDQLVKEIVAPGQTEWYYSEIARMKDSPFVVFRDTVSLLVDVRKFRAYIGNNKMAQ